MIRLRPLPYQPLLAQRPLQQIDLLVIHCTELPDLATAREYGERLLYPVSQDQQNAVDDDPIDQRGTGNSGHYYIDRDGSTEQWVDHERIAHHVRGFNPRSIGIELVNRGRYPDWYHSERQQMTETYPGQQISALLWLINQLQQSLPALRWIAAHADLDLEFIAATNDATIQVHSKLDPGPLFPWPLVMSRCQLQRLKP
ncbi:MAG TPA: N-acetylmuramoyl-L-alanine amidase [Xanthomonadales bacterium]|nr:N-acetylmuramoyl-L-alanine amidase [Xanthomonadales bacterium]